MNHSEKKRVDLLFIISITVLIVAGAGLIWLNNYTQNNQATEQRNYVCSGAQDGTPCTVGLQYDDPNQACDDNNCDLLEIGKCYNEECVFNDESDDLINQ